MLLNWQLQVLQTLFCVEAVAVRTAVMNRTKLRPVATISELFSFTEHANYGAFFSSYCPNASFIVLARW